MIKFFKPSPKHIEFALSNLTTGLVVGYQIWQNVRNDKNNVHAEERNTANQQPLYSAKPR